MIREIIELVHDLGHFELVCIIVCLYYVTEASLKCTHMFLFVYQQTSFLLRALHKDF